MMTTENSGALVAGAPAPSDYVMIEMKRAQSVQGQMFEAGAVIEAPAADARWLVRRGHAEYVK